MRQKLDGLAAAIAAHDARGAEAAVAVVRATDDQARMDAIRRVIGQVTEAEKALVVARAAAVQRDEQRAVVVAAVVGALSLLTRVGVEMLLGYRAKVMPGAATSTADDARPRAPSPRTG